MEVKSRGRMSGEFGECVCTRGEGGFGFDGRIRSVQKVKGRCRSQGVLNGQVRVGLDSCTGHEVVFKGF